MKKKLLVVAVLSVLGSGPSQAFNIGVSSYSDVSASTAVGDYSAASVSGVSVGSNSSSTGGGVAIGAGFTSAGNQAVAVGHASASSGFQGVALGANSSDSGVANTVSVGNQSIGLYRTVTNVANGVVADGSHDVVTGDQLFDTNTTLATVGDAAAAAMNVANAAQTTANTAQTAAAAAQTTANTAQTTANTALGNAATAQATANAANTKATTALSNIAAETTARIAGDAALQGEVDAVETGLMAEATARIAGDAALQTAVDNEAATRAAADTAETTARIAGDAALQGEVDAVETGLMAEATARIAGDAALQTAVDNEAATRAAADTAETTARIAGDAALQAGVATAQSAANTAQGAAQAAQSTANEALGVATAVTDLAVGANVAAQEAKGMAGAALDMGVQNSMDIADIQGGLRQGMMRIASVEEGLSNSVPFDTDGGISLRTDVDGNPTGGIHNVADGTERYDAVNLGQMQAGDAATLASANSYTDKAVAEGVAASLAMPFVGFESGKTRAAGIAVGHYGGKTAAGVGFATKLNVGRLDLGLSGVEGGKAATKVGYSLSW